MVRRAIGLTGEIMPCANNDITTNQISNCVNAICHFEENQIKKKINTLTESTLSKIIQSFLVTLLFMIIPTKANSTEFNYFKLTDVEGSMRLGYSLNEREVKQLNGFDSYEKRPTTEQELNINTRSYVFHPNLLEMELGAGVRFEQQELENDSVTNDSKGVYYDFSGRFNILKNKPYPISLYYSQRNPTQEVGVADSLNVETQNYGMTVSLRSPLVKTPITLHLDHNESRGESAVSIIDDTIDAISLNIRTNIGESGNGYVGLSNVTQSSGSGNRNLPLQESTSETQSIDWNGRVKLGTKRNISIDNYLLLSRNEQSIAPDRDQITFYNHINWEIDDSIETFNTYNYSSLSYDEIESNNESIIFGASHRLRDSLTYNVSVEAAKESNLGFAKTSYGLNGGVNSKVEINDRWVSSFGYAVLYRVNSQTTDQSNINILDESHALNGLTAISLDNEFVVSGSVIVSNQTHTQIYVENIDYIIRIVGTETRLERLPTGNIGDGQVVLVTYQYETGGTFDYNEFNQSASLIYSLDRRYNFSIFYSTDNQYLQSGIPARSLQSVQRYRLEADAQIPINTFMDYGYELEFERRIDDLHPFSRRALDINWNSSLPFYASYIRVSTGYEYVDNELSTNDIRETYLSTILSARPGWGSVANVSWTYTRDRGGDTDKNISNTTLGYTWSRGRLDFTLSGKHTIEEQGNALRKNTMIEASLRRHFR